MAKSRSKGSYMISSVAEQYEIHPQTLRLYEREGLLRPSRSEGNTRLYTDGDLERLEVILHLTRDLGVNLAGVEIILNMREKMSEMQRQIQEFVAGLNRELAAHARTPGPDERNYPFSFRQKHIASLTQPPRPSTRAIRQFFVESGILSSF
ncbi:MAG: MerR family transcriptional regulator [Acidobacteria bacterium]|nr:MAG: MerR family transcriptional regulator [Acidobacteriota bacterium]